jgi:hypothetical protein
MPVTDPIALIVCSDERAETLARVLSGRFQVLHVDQQRFNVWQNDGFQIVSDIKTVPAKFDCLFFHTGENDPKHIPPDRSYTREFAFSGAGLPAGKWKDRSTALMIPAAFVGKDCPIRHWDLPGIVAFVTGATEELPPFCVPQHHLYANVLGALLQGYLCVKASESSDQANQLKAQLDDCGWISLDETLRDRLQPELAPLATEVGLSSWWMRSGVSKLVEGEGWEVLKARLRAELNLKHEAPLPAPLELLLDILHSGGIVEPKCAAEAYDALASGGRVAG